MPVPSDRLASVSIRDVASEAGVSHQTVSRVINESPSVKESTRQVVLDAIARLDFRPEPRRARLGRGAGAVGHGVDVQYPAVWLCCGSGRH